nr:GLPGLI family protein [Pseudopedobacter sp.]
MKNSITILSILLLSGVDKASAQFAHFTNHGVIEFEKSVNMFAVLKPKEGDDNVFQKAYYEKYRSSQPQFTKFRSKLLFDQNKSYFQPNQEDNDKFKGGFWGSGGNPTQINEVFTNLTQGVFTTKKAVFEDNFIVKDSVRKIDWKITSEVREIAGYNCRRANALIMDSIYVVAFYTDEIPVSGGPESFTGLPGMILGIALPYEHVTWFATKVTDMPVPDKDFVIPIKGKPATLKSLKEIILQADDYFKDSLKAFML